jgi:acyl-CoA synthetase (AMP-forming)/AMP-acid ligase II
MTGTSDDLTVSAAFFGTAAKFADRPFLAVLEETARIYDINAGEITYGEMAAEARRLSASYAAAGYGCGDRIGLLLENRPAFFRHWLALNDLGVSVVPINPDLKSAELEYLVAHSEMCAAVVLQHRQADIVDAAAAGKRMVAVFGPNDTIPAARVGIARLADRPNADTECALLYTSGTTGRPKGCVLANTYFLNQGRWYLEVGGYVQIEAGRERMLTPLPLFHTNAMVTSSMTMIMSGGCLIVLDRFHPRSWWHSVRSSEATIVHYLGVMPPMLMAAESSLDDKNHYIRFGFGAGVDARVHGPFEQRFGFPLIEAWAMTETCGAVIISAAHEPRHVGTNCFGRTGPEAEARVVDDLGNDVERGMPGELIVRRSGTDPRHGFFKEYLKDREATEEAWAGGWFHTGDVVRQDAVGDFYFVDRKKNVIRRSGENISAVEVESVLQQHPAVGTVAVGATPDDVRGDEVFACIVPRTRQPDADARVALAHELVAHCASRLAYYKAPGWIAFVEALPVTATQKIQRGALKDLIAKLRMSTDVIDLRALKKRSG